MGASESTQKLGERVMTARKKLEEDQKMQSERAQSLRDASSSTMMLTLDRMQESFERFAPFLERTLLVAWEADSDKCKQFMLKACEKVLSAPIKEDEYDWFKKYVLPSSLWMAKANENRFMYQHLMDIVNKQSADIIKNMDCVYRHLQTHEKWSELMAIQNESVVDRQDDAAVGLLHEDGIQSVAESKNEKDEEIASFVDSHVAVQALTVTANTVNKEFQTYIESVMSQYGEYKAGPMKKVERCLSKLENDYYDAAYPKSAKLLDLVRCSVNFNTLEQLLLGYKALVADMARPSSDIKMARVKNGFLDKTYDGGYRDIKVNVIFQSAVKPELKMICEVQLILSQYLNEKKRIHKLYSIEREETFFEMVVKEEDANSGAQKEVKDLQLNQHFNLKHDVPALSYTDERMYKCSVDSATQLLAVEGYKFKCSVDSATQLLAVEGLEWFGVVDMKQKKCVLDLEKGNVGHQSSFWLTIKDEKYVSVQVSKKEIVMYKVVADNDSYKLVRDDKYKIVDEGEIIYCEFDRECNHFVLLVNGDTLQLRSLSNVNTVKKSIALDEEVQGMFTRSMQLSANGQRCVLSGGLG
eukprot:CAMPEP_0202729016 /NCGR_PEP_ID=MMETSP1385-20130828/185916_1 /ASSEMBLY_ACC=CAM_ASM_000861 /TAXON_ID=933848 /ORGANISM="Elphidium margaritaceum" /LENGTH=582 /DNA_ID=CAMNT_0049395269 /DNA_START=53 /DNA_END=1797 /DNA_ORIENTATION=-